VKEKSDEELFVDVGKDNKIAFDIIFRKYYAALCRFANTFIKDKDEVEDVVQQVFILLWSQRSKIMITSSLKAYLYISVRNTSLNLIKKKKIRSDYEQNSNTGENFVQPEKHDEGNNEFIKTTISKAVDTLPEKCKEVFTLSRNEGLTHEEISEYLNISKKTVEKQIGIALKKLRELIKPHFPGYVRRE